MSKYLPNTSVPKTSSGSATTQSSLLFGVQCDAAGTVTIYDNASAASGTILAVGKAGDTVVFNNPVVANNGIYVSMTGTGAIAYVTVS